MSAHMPRLLHIMDYAPRGTRTFDHFLLEMAKEFANRGWKIRYAFNAEPPAEFEQALRQVGAESVVIPFPFNRRSVRELVQRLNGYRPDVTQTSFVSAFTRALIGFKLRGYTRRLVVIDHSSGQTPERHGWKRWLTQLRGWAVGKVVDAVVPVSETIARRDIERVFLPSHKVRVVYNGVRLDHFLNPIRPPREVIRVVYAGQLIPEKGLITLLQAHDRLRRAGVRNYELLVAGKGPQEAELKAFCTATGRDDVQFLGHIDSVSELFGSADIVVIPSQWHEAFGYVAAEAMACGAVCLVSDAGALPEVVGEAGRVFRTGDDSDLAAKLKELIDSPESRSRLGRTGRSRVESFFTLGKQVTQHIAVCETVLRGEALSRIEVEPIA